MVYFWRGECWAHRSCLALPTFGKCFTEARCPQSIGGGEVKLKGRQQGVR